MTPEEIEEKVFHSTQLRAYYLWEKLGKPWGKEELIWTIAEQGKEDNETIEKFRHIFQWTDALESGEFEQGKGMLCVINDNRHAYCCLGIAAELYRQAHPDKYRWVGQCGFRSLIHKVHLVDALTSSLNTEVADWFGTRQSDRFISELMRLNDGISQDDWKSSVARKTFPEIAERIKKELMKGSNGAFASCFL